MFYVIYAECLANFFENKRYFFARLQLLHDEGKLLTAGLMPTVDSNDPGASGFTGSLVIAEFESLEAAKSWAADDLYIASGLYHKVTINPYKPYTNQTIC